MKGAINLTMQKKSKLLKKAASIDELPIEENPFFLDAAEDDGQEDEEPKMCIRDRSEAAAFGREEEENGQTK